MARIQQRGASVEYSLDEKAPEWLRHTLGDDFIGTGVDVVFMAMEFRDGDFHYAPDEKCPCDDDLRTVAEIEWLRGLFVHSHRLTDAGLEHLHKLRRLEEVTLLGTQVTPAGIKRLQDALPECEIECAPDTEYK